MKKLIKIVGVELRKEQLRGYEGKIVARPTGLIKIQKVYLKDRIDYCFLDKESETVYGNSNMPLFDIVGWDFLHEEQGFFPIMESQKKYTVEHLKRRNGLFVFTPPDKFQVNPVKMFLNEKDELTFRYPGQ
jgi:hypothetical protein